MHFTDQASDGDKPVTAESIFQEIKQALNGRPGQPIVLGVCKTLAARINKEVWCVRLALIVLGLFWTLPIVAAYVVLGFVLPDTEDRTRGFFTGLGITARETAERVFASLGRIFTSDSRSGPRSGSYRSS